MTLLEAIEKRHSVRAYQDRAIDPEARQALLDTIQKAAEEGQLNIQLVEDDPTAFTGFMAHYGKFRGVRDYIIFAGKKSHDLDERIGYYGERIVLEAQRLGLNTCWVGLTFTKHPERYRLANDEKLRCVISIGYGTTQGSGHRIKSYDRVSQTAQSEAPEWFIKGVETALLAPTAINQQKFRFTLMPDGSVKARAGMGFFSKVDLGIVKQHFEIGAAPQKVVWN